MFDWLKELLGLKGPAILGMSSLLPGTPGGSKRDPNNQSEQVVKEFDEALNQAEQALSRQDLQAAEQALKNADRLSNKLAIRHKIFGRMNKKSKLWQRLTKLKREQRR